MNLPQHNTAQGGGQRSAIATNTGGSSLADVLERVLDKGIVIAGDISVSVAQTELLNIRIRLLISSVDKAREIGINWWENNPHWSAQAAQFDPHHPHPHQHQQQQQQQLQAQTQTLLEQNQALTDWIAALEAQVKTQA